jgi:SAM-dependent methyltransferase
VREKQVDADHYRFSRYVSKNRWASIWHQLDEVLRTEPESVLEIGPGPGLFKVLAGLFGIRVETADIDPALRPDHLISGENLPFPDKSFDVACAFQVLEHVPYAVSLAVFAEMSRVAKRYVVISLPDARPTWFYSFRIPLVGQFTFLAPKPWTGPKEHTFDGEHYWEVNKKGFKLNKVCSDLATTGHLALVRTFRVDEFAFHRFFIFEKR